MQQSTMPRESKVPEDVDSGKVVPDVSVVIASVNGLPYIGECIESLVHQEGDVVAEILVMDCCGEETRKVLRERFPQPEVKLIAVDGRASIPALRAMGIARARGRMVAITEDHCIANPHWLEVIQRAHEKGYEAVGGPVANGAVDRSVDWAVFFCEYARFLPPIAEGVIGEIPGNNSAYDRFLLERLGPEVRVEAWESFLHHRMRQRGVQFYNDPAMVIVHKKDFRFAYFMSQRYHYSRSFAGARLDGQSWTKRVIYAAGTTVLPLLLLWRMIASISRKGHHGKEFVLSLPFIGAFLISWAWGEAVGALLGPGDSLRKVE